MLAAEKVLFEKKLDKEYLPITGDAEFTKLATRLAYGADSKPLAEGRVAATQSLSGTGALRLAMAFLSYHYGGPKQVYLPEPTWGNHIPVVEQTGMKVVRYRYFDKKTIGLDFEGMKEDLEVGLDPQVDVLGLINDRKPNLAPLSVCIIRTELVVDPIQVLLHACAQNPTGVDPSQDQWRELSKLIKAKKHVVIFDMAYQGFASGDVDRDAFAMRHFVEEGHQLLLCQSFAKVSFDPEQPVKS